MPVHRLRHRLTIWSTIFALVFAPGCSRRFWREQAEKDTYHAVSEKLDDQRWAVPRTSITPDKRSRFYDPYDPDASPLPPDDPAAHKFMHNANGIKGYKSWHKFGDSISVENPQWLEPFGVTLDGNGDVDPVSAHTSVELKEITLEEAIELSYIHSRDYQTNLENLYLDALALTFQRFQFGVRYLGVSGREPSLSLDAGSQPGRDSWGTGQAFGISQALPAGGQWAVELANNTLWLFGTGGGPPTSGSSLAFSLVQPLLFQAGRQVAMEGLTQAERNVLYTARDLARFRKTFFVSTTNGYLGILEQKQGIINTENNIFQLEEQIAQAQFRNAVRRPISLSAPLVNLPDGAEIPESLAEKLSYDDVGFLVWRGRTISEEESQAMLAISDDAAYLRAAREIIDRRRGDSETTPIDVLQLLTELSNAENGLRGQERALQDRLDAFKVQLGLPPDVTLDLDSSRLEPFELISSDLRGVEMEIKDTLTVVRRSLEESSDFTKVAKFVEALATVAESLEGTALTQVGGEFAPVEGLLADTENGSQRVFGSDEERSRVTADLDRDKRLYQTAKANFARAKADLTQVQDLVRGASPDAPFKKLDLDGNQSISVDELRKSRLRSVLGDPQKLDRDEDGVLTSQQLLDQTERACYEIRERMLVAAQTLQVVQAGLRAEQIAVNRFVLSESDSPSIEEVVRIGLKNRLDLMNEKALVMDARRRLEIAANALEATLDLQVSGSVGTRAGNRNPFDFRQDESRLDIGLNLTTPLDQIQERNDYASALVAYQRARRSYMAFEDSVKTQIRNSWRQLQVAEQRLEIDRRQIRQAALQYDNAAQATSNPDQRAGGGDQDALNLLRALTDLLRAQNGLIADWINYETNRLNIFSDMGIMEINPRGIWTDEFYLQSQNPPADAGLNGDGGDADVPPSLPDAPPTPNEDASDENANEAPGLLPIPAPPNAAARRIKPVDIARVGYSRGGRRVSDSVVAKRPIR